MTPMCRQIVGEVQMRQFAATLASLSRQGDCVLLEGELGAGKTAFARGFIQALADSPVEVTSPTFTLVQTYALSPSCTVWHFDLYRLKSDRELAEIGLDEALQHGITLIEWPQLAEDMVPQDALRLTLRHGDDPEARTITLMYQAGDWQERLKALGEV